ncbi:hypothetical protein AQUCO_00800269v1 [Aquilegia coerulea]|uniref:Uncharacterized protein n=1 Tax=Aquilegia coerulea TaxID=218851 RepID=A0A2G5EHZ6_AQUCA|nr:hypothetical protein AQUCO_00800269v1 [Aquilegia coerulea]
MTKIKRQDNKQVQTTVGLGCIFHLPGCVRAIRYEAQICISHITCEYAVYERNLYRGFKKTNWLLRNWYH